VHEKTRVMIDKARRWVLIVVEDDKDTRDVLVDFLGEAGYQAKAVGSGAAAMEILQTGRPCMILADYLLDDMDGKELRRQIPRVSWHRGASVRASDRLPSVQAQGHQRRHPQDADQLRSSAGRCR
jgi:CheY-like chemotaxis protein